MLTSINLNFSKIKDLWMFLCCCCCCNEYDCAEVAYEFEMVAQMKKRQRIIYGCSTPSIVHSPWIPSWVHQYRVRVIFASSNIKASFGVELLCNRNVQHFGIHFTNNYYEICRMPWISDNSETNTDWMLFLILFSCSM